MDTETQGEDWLVIRALIDLYSPSIGGRKIWQGGGVVIFRGIVNSVNLEDVKCSETESPGTVQESRTQATLSGLK